MLSFPRRLSERESGIAAMKSGAAMMKSGAVMKNYAVVAMKGGAAPLWARKIKNTD